MRLGFDVKKLWAEKPMAIKLNALGIGAAIAVLVALPMVMGSVQPGFFSGYHSLSRNYQALQTSGHTDIACGQCHIDSRGTVVSKLALVGDFYANIAKKDKAAVFVKFDSPSNEACVSCHREDWSEDSSQTATVPHPAHLRVLTEKRECVKCHKWTAHEEVYMQKHKTMPFSGVCVAYGCHVGTKTTEECDTCHHSLRTEGPKWSAEHPKVVGEIGANACFESCHDNAQCVLCHTTGKTPVFTGLATKTGLEAIETLHIKATWIKQHGSVALKDESKCFACHVSDAECKDCHSIRPAFHGSTRTWTGVHKNVSKDERRCLACHEKPWCEECHDAFKEMR